MKEKVIAWTLLIVGFYIFFGNTILSILFYDVKIPCMPTPNGVYCVPLEQLNIFEMWFNEIGGYTIAIAILGLVFIILGCYYFVIKNELESTEDIVV
ncbi:MAG: hypothetical protein ACFE9Q_11885 [Candidatus Hodarchaeota archaeon]